MSNKIVTKRRFKQIMLDFWNDLKQRYKAIKILVVMQLKEKLNVKGNKLSGFKILSTIIFAIVKFALIVVLCFLLMYFAGYLGLFSLFPFSIPVSVVTVIFTIMLLLSIISSTMGLNKSMYYSRDNQILLTLPCKATDVYLSKIILFYIYELLRNLSFMVPVFIAYGIYMKYSISYYPFIFILFIFISMIPVLLGTILSVPVMWFYNFFRQYKRLQVATLIVLVTGVVVAVVKLISLIPPDINFIKTWGTTFWQIQDFLNMFITKFSGFHEVVLLILSFNTSALSKITLLNPELVFLKIIGAIIILFILGFVTVRPLFYKMASKPFEYRKQLKKAKPNKITKKSLSPLKTELLLSIRSSEKVFMGVGILIAMPILMMFLNKMYAAMDTRTLGNNMVVSFNILIMLLIVLSSNTYASSIFSQDGRSSYLIKVQPSKYQPLLIAKLAFNTILMMLAFIATGIVLYYNMKLDVVKIILIMLTVIFIYFAHLFYSAELDIMNPQVELYATIGNSDKNPNETKSTVLTFLISFVVFGIFLFLLTEDAGNITYIKMAFICLIIMLFRLYMLFNKIKLYYKEK